MICKSFKRVLWVLFFSVIFVLLSVSVYFQIKAEYYRAELDENYSLFQGMTRKSYKPFVIFYIQSKSPFNKYSKCWTSMYNMYEREGIFEKGKKNSVPNTFMVSYNIENNAYLIYCFFGEEGYPIHLKDG